MFVTVTVIGVLGDERFSGREGQTAGQRQGERCGCVSTERDAGTRDPRRGDLQSSRVRHPAGRVEINLRLAALSQRQGRSAGSRRCQEACTRRERKSGYSRARHRDGDRCALLVVPTACAANWIVDWFATSALVNGVVTTERERYASELSGVAAAGVPVFTRFPAMPGASLTIM